MRQHWKYLRYLICHKYFVFLAGLKTGAPLWRLLIHDWSKLTPSEWGPYAQWFYGHPKDMDAAREAFDRAWLHHQHHNSHHWQHWNLRDDTGELKMLPIPLDAVKEMVADWMGAGRALNGEWEAIAWYAKAGQQMQLHPESRRVAEEILRRACQ